MNMTTAPWPLKTINLPKLRSMIQDNPPGYPLLTSISQDVLRDSGHREDGMGGEGERRGSKAAGLGFDQTPLPFFYALPLPQLETSYNTINLVLSG